jgi:hypothetical protein
MIKIIFYSPHFFTLTRYKKLKLQQSFSVENTGVKSLLYTEKKAS